MGLPTAVASWFPDGGLVWRDRSEGQEAQPVMWGLIQGSDVLLFSFSLDPQPPSSLPSLSLELIPLISFCPLPWRIHITSENISLALQIPACLQTALALLRKLPFLSFSLQSLVSETGQLSYFWTEPIHRSFLK